MTQYLPASEVSKVVNFIAFSGTVSAFQTALNTAFGATAGNIQCMADTTTGQTANALVIVNDNFVMSVAPSNVVSWTGGQWVQLSPTQLAAQYVQYFTS